MHNDSKGFRGVTPQRRAQIEAVVAAGRQAAAAAGARLSPPAARAASLPAASGRPAVPVLAGAAGAIVLLIAGMLLGGVLRPTKGVPDAVGPRSPAVAPGGQGAAGTSANAHHPTGPTAGAAATAQAVADASTAQSQAAQAVAASDRAETLLQSAQAAAAQIERRAAPALARTPSATDPATLLQPLQQQDAQMLTLVARAQQAAAATAAAAKSVAELAATDAGAADAASRGQAAQSEAQTAYTQARTAGAEVGRLVTQAESRVQAWEDVHGAPPGYFGAQVENPPADWTVHGCEVQTAAPGSPAAAAGLVGKAQRTDPVGDVISAVTDATDAGTGWRVPDCAAFEAAMAQTRAGDQVTVSYYHREVIWYELSGRWVPESGSATLAAAPGANCPAPLTGAITPALTGNRIDLTIGLSGPSGTRPDLSVMLDTGGVQSYFPDGLLRGLGYRPFLPTLAGGIVPGAVGRANLYHIPATAIRVRDGGQDVPLATGTLTVMGIVGGSMQALGPDILKQGARLTTAGGRWTLTPPCA